MFYLYRYIIWIDMDNEINSYVTKLIPFLYIIWLDNDNTFIVGMLYLLCHPSALWEKWGKYVCILLEKASIILSL